MIQDKNESPNDRFKKEMMELFQKRQLERKIFSIAIFNMVLICLFLIQVFLFNGVFSLFIFFTSGVVYATSQTYFNMFNRTPKIKKFRRYLADFFIPYLFIFTGLVFFSYDLINVFTVCSALFIIVMSLINFYYYIRLNYFKGKVV